MTPSEIVKMRQDIRRYLSWKNWILAISAIIICTLALGIELTSQEQIIPKIAAWLTVPIVLLSIVYFLRPPIPKIPKDTYCLAIERRGLPPLYFLFNDHKVDEYAKDIHDQIKRDIIKGKINYPPVLCSQFEFKIKYGPTNDEYTFHFGRLSEDPLDIWLELAAIARNYPNIYVNLQLPQNGLVAIFENFASDAISARGNEDLKDKCNWINEQIREYGYRINTVDTQSNSSIIIKKD